MTASRAPFALWLLAPLLAGCPSSVDTAAVDAQPSKSFLVGKSAAGGTEGQSEEAPPPGVGSVGLMSLLTVFLVMVASAR